ncbi:hypothetical protein [Paenibacillus physcomitrellae]|uniref:Uncharacterized protein n=1 Tax=Paenibacillus physcomitrellae TaxID=1619311 RepID=A0ABQ1GMT0_9BACL|nr:hypothetical protein [Paenibacillus physcomitrellae]GGA46894.1 hypothetical protein GCM10010917_35190 [Paenibacillus physcomitrellae]
MEAKELSVILSKMSAILSLYDDVAIEEALDDIYKMVRANKREKSGNITKNENEVDFSISEELISMMSKMSSEELTKYLQENEQFQSKGAILKLARTLSITTSTRNNVPTLSHSIVKFFERQKMDKLIREDRNADVSGEEKL